MAGTVRNAVPETVWVHPATDTAASATDNSVDTQDRAVMS